MWEVYSKYIEKIDSALQNELELYSESEFCEPLKYALDGGKRIRPIISLLAAECVGEIDENVYAYERNGRSLQITTFTISSDGATITELDSLLPDATNCNDRLLQSLVKVDSDTVARAYCGSGGDGYLRTFSIAENGDITKKSTYEFDTSQGSEHFLVQVDSDTIAVAYENAEVSGGSVTERNGVIKTFTINSSDEISEADSLEHHSGNTPSTGNAEDNFLVKVDSDTFVLAYDDGSNNDGFISTFTIDSDGNITGLRTANGGDNLEHDTSHSTNRSLVKVDSNTVLVVTVS